MKAKMRKIGRLKDYTTGKVGKLESKSGEFFIAFQHKDGEAIFLSQELQEMIDKSQEIAKIKKVLGWQPKQSLDEVIVEITEYLKTNDA